MTKNQKKWDIFCKIVDNFGDIGVCWRLAKQLHQEHGLSIRLFIDDLPTAAKMLAGISNVDEQIYEGVTIMRWDSTMPLTYVADVVLETFACGLPAAYLKQMCDETVWVNVDYLSAESWVPEFHALNGKHRETGLIRHFYFPGFNEQTGGLLREQHLITHRDDFQSTTHQQRALWQCLDVMPLGNELTVSFFSYDNAPVHAFLQALVDGEQPTRVFMPLNHHIPTPLLNQHDLAVGDEIQTGNLTLHILPFLSQENYDALLWACDINFVRGEDSWVRAIWSGKPFIWQPYWQEDNAHLLKLNAFLDSFYVHPAIDHTLTTLHTAWSTESFHHEAWQDYLHQLDVISAHTKQQSNYLIQQDDLATKLVAFCANLLN